MDEKSVMKVEDKCMVKAYAKRPLVLSKGEGVYLWDINGKKYLDFTGNYGVCILGYSYPEIVKAIKSQAEKLTACHGSFYNEIRANFLEKLTKIALKGLNKAFFGKQRSRSC